jgi:hypothetical protein
MYIIPRLITEADPRKRTKYKILRSINTEADPCKRQCTEFQDSPQMQIQSEDDIQNCPRCRSELIHFKITKQYSLTKIIFLIKPLSHHARGVDLHASVGRPYFKNMVLFSGKKMIKIVCLRRHTGS